MQTERIKFHFVAYDVIETEVDVVCKVRKNVLEVVPQGLRDLDVSLLPELSVNLCVEIGDHQHLIVEEVFGLTIAGILIHETAAGEGCRPENK